MINGIQKQEQPKKRPQNCKLMRTRQQWTTTPRKTTNYDIFFKKLMDLNTIIKMQEVNGRIVEGGQYLSQKQSVSDQHGPANRMTEPKSHKKYK